MASTTTSSLSRYRPAVLLTTVGAVALTSYLIYTSLPPRNELQRRDAVRRQHPRRHRPVFPEGGTQGVQNRLDQAAGQTTVYGTGIYYETELPLTLQNLALPHIQSRIRPPENLTQAEWEGLLENVQRDFLQYFLRWEFGARPVTEYEQVLILQFMTQRGITEEVITQGFEIYTGGRPHQGQRPSQESGDRPERVIQGTQDLDERMTVAVTDTSSFGTTIEDTEHLKRAIFYVAEDRTKQEGVIHRGITCDQCDTKPIRGVRWRCANCADFDLCSYCEADSRHDKTHIFYKVRVPAPYLGYPRQPMPPVYPGRPDMMPNTIPREIKKKMSNETKVSSEEIDGLWEQFTCLANTRWENDPNHVGWAIDRKAFDKAFKPHYSQTTPAPNLIYDRIFSFYDTNGDSLIGFEEFLKGLDTLHSRDSSVRLRVAFDGYDIDRDGLVTRKDFLRLFRAYYAIQKESTRDYIAVHTEALSVAGALDTIRSSQPLASNFNEVPIPAAIRHRHTVNKRRDNFGDPLDDEPVLSEDFDNGLDRNTFFDFEANSGNRREQGDPLELLQERWDRRQFYVDEEEGYDPPDRIRNGNQTEDLSSVAGADGTHTEAASTAGTVGEQARTQEDGILSPESTLFPTIEDEDEIPGLENPSPGTGLLTRTSRSSSRVRFQDDVELETRSNASTHASTSSRPVGERWGGYEIPQPEKDLGRELLYQITQQGFNELLDPLFREKEDLAMETYATKEERQKWKHLIEAHVDSPSSSMDSMEEIAWVAHRLGPETFGHDFERIIKAITDKKHDEYKELGPNQGCIEYVSDVRIAEREILHENAANTEVIERGPGKTEMVAIQQVFSRVIEDTWRNIHKLLFDTEEPSNDTSVLDSNIVSQPLENLLAQAGYDVAGSVADESPSAPAEHDHIAAHLADARRQVQEMTNDAESITHQTAEVVQQDTQETAHRDPTLPQFRPNTIDEIPALGSESPTPRWSADVSSSSLLPLLYPHSNPTTSDQDYSDDSDTSYFTDSVADPTIEHTAIIIDPTNLIIGGPNTSNATAQEIIDMLRAATTLTPPIPPSSYVPKDQAAHHAAYMNAAKYFHPDASSSRQPPAWRLERLALLEKHEEEMYARGGPGRITFNEFEKLVIRDGDMGQLRYVEGWLECVGL